MKAVVIEGKKIIKYRDVEDPNIANDEVLINVKYCGICGTDIALYLGEMAYLQTGEQKYPFIPGHEWSGEVVDIGNNIKNFKVGDRVTGDVSIGCGKCGDCREGRFNLCNNRFEVGCYRNKSGGMAEYIKMPERHLYKIPKNVDFMGGAIVEPLATAVHGIKRKIFDLNENILITGGGFIGILAAQVASASKSTTVVLTGRTKEKLDAAVECGIENVVNIKERDLQEYLKNLGILDNINFCVECSGNIDVLKQCIEIVRPGGDISIIGFYESNETNINFDDISLKNLEIHGVLASPNCFKSAISLLEKGLIKYKPLVTEIFELREIDDAIKFILDRKNKSIRVMLKIG